MNMRASEGFSKDYITGTVKKVEKLKPVDSTVRAVHKIQLFRESDGELVQEHESENFIGVTWEDLQKAYARAVLLCHSFSSGDGSYSLIYGHNTSGWLFSHQSNFTGLFGHPIPSGNSPWNRMVLTDYAEPERPLTERCMFGKVIGWAEREVAYSGTDTRRGGYNRTESFKDIANKQIRFVWDFATHAANGTFNSIYWNPFETTNQVGYIDPGHVQITAPANFRFDHAQAYGMKVKGTKLYIAVHGTADTTKRGLAVYNIDYTNCTITPDATTPIIVINHNARIYDFDFNSAGDIYILTNAQQIIRINPATGSPVALHGGTTNTSFIPQGMHTTGSGYMNQIAIINDILYITYQSNAGATTSLLGVASGSGVVSYNLSDCTFRDANVTHTTTMGNVYFCPSTDYENLQAYTQTGAAYHSYDASIGATLASPSRSNTPALLSATFYWPGPYSGANIVKVNNEPMLLSYSWGAISDKVTVRFQHVGQIGGRNLLPAPVTKTNEYTMKVTYDLFFE